MDENKFYIPGHRFFIRELDGMKNPSPGYCSHYGKFEVFVVSVFINMKQRERVLVEIIGNINE